ncbi:MAG: glycosyltransferase family 2 protein [Candidatus Moranbacteria bacterium]|nr:glycosyltransferase family 2 protein [Candidatus Moranbacteria bacterium]
MPIPEKMPELSIVIVNFKSADMLSKALGALLFGVEKDWVEIVIVNNDPLDDDAIRRLGASYRVRIISLPENRGFGAASNVGVYATRGRIIGFLNPDTFLSSGSLKSITRYFADKPKVGIVGAGLISRDNRPERWSAGRGASFFVVLANKLRLTRSRIGENQDGAIPVDWVSGAAMFMRRDLFDALHGFDENFFLYFEDMDLCIRARQAGFDVVRFSDPSFLHHGGGSMPSTDEQRRRYFESQEMYFLKHRPYWEVMLLRSFRRLFK